MEVQTHEGRRIDVVVRMPGAILGVENKPSRYDRPAQVSHYLAWLDRQMPDGHRCLVYISGSEDALPSEKSIAEAERVARDKDGQFRATSYPGLLPWLTRTRGMCEAETFLSFLDGLMRYVRMRFMGVRDMTERERLVEVVVHSRENLGSAIQVIAAANDIKKSVMATFATQIRTALPEGYALSEFYMSEGRFNRLSVDLPGGSGLRFSAEFQATNFNYLIYGVSKRDPAMELPGVKARLDAAFGPGVVTPDWPWYRRASPAERVFPVETDWRTAEEPWVAASDGTLARIVAEAARAFHDVLEGAAEPALPLANASAS